MGKRRWLLYAFLAVIVLSAIAVFYAGKYPSTQTVSDEPVAEDAAEDSLAVGRNVTFTFTENAHKKWDLKAAEAQYFNDQLGADLTQVEGAFYDENAKVIATFKAPRGKYWSKTSKVRLEGNVLVEGAGEDATRLQSDTMTWGEGKKQVEATGNVVVTHGQQGKSTGQRCRFTLDFTYIAIEGNAVSEFGL